ncbi:recombinase family protein [Brevundimonas sp. A19_0]|uniref:recombinase family protein n=1 Tax=Brevundimonas sp. A19_0 TaxID=2821087 RepID=UPI001AD9BBE0|nr:recombinase family protein [Brevundimonas sp. A19_0]MBO9500965.1 recombinase family protein [Brevundimonas sp. A19_0]
MPNIYSYVRFSTKAQEKGASIERQRQEIDKVCAERGWLIHEQIEDLGRSAWKGHHLNDAAGLGDFANRVRTGLIPRGSTLVIENVDRLSREEPIDVLTWMVELNRHGLNFFFAEGRTLFDHSTLRGQEAGWRLFQLWGGSERAKGESDRKSEIMRKAWRRKQEAAAERREVMTSQAPLWLVLREDRSGFHVDQDRAGVVREIYQLCADGVSIRGIARILNKRGCKAWGPQGTEYARDGWSMTSIRRLLTAPQVEGDYVPKSVQEGQPTRIIGYYDRIVDAALVARAREALESRKSGVQGSNSNKFNNLFSGLVRCGRCGGKMEFRKPWARGNNGPETRRGYFNCLNASLKRGCDVSATYRYGTFEDAALKTLLSHALNDETFRDGAEARARENDLAEAEKNVRDLQAQIDRAVDYLLTSPSRAVKGRLEKLEGELAEAEREVMDARIALRKTEGAIGPGEALCRIAEVQEAIHSEDEEVRRLARAKVTAALKGIVDMVICDPADTHGGQVRRTLTVVCVGGAQNYKFENKGGLIAEAGVLADLDKGLGHAEGVGADDPRTRRRLDALQRRPKQTA